MIMDHRITAMGRFISKEIRPLLPHEADAIDPQPCSPRGSFSSEPPVSPLPQRHHIIDIKISELFPVFILNMKSGI